METINSVKVDRFISMFCMVTKIIKIKKKVAMEVKKEFFLNFLSVFGTFLTNLNLNLINDKKKAKKRRKKKN